MKTNIKRARDNRGMTQKECADKLGITLRAWQTYEQGVSEPKNELLCKIADMFGVSVDYLLGRETIEQSTIDQLAREFNMTALERKILDNYIALPADMRGDLMEFLYKAVTEVERESKSENENGEVKVYRAASSKDNHPDEITTLSKEEAERLKNAPRMTDENSDL